MDQKITKDTKFRTGSGDIVTFDEMAERIIAYIKAIPGVNYNIAIGTDSQTYDETKVVLAVTVHRVGNGGIFFVKSIYHEAFRITQLQDKLYEETHISLTATEMLFESLLDHGFDITDEANNVHLTVHIDVGKNGATKAYISELEGWVRAMGYDTAIKPDSYAASFVADKYSK